MDLAAYLRTLLGNREDIWRISSIFALKKIGLGNRFNHCEDINNATSRVELDVNFVLRFLDPGRINQGYSKSHCFLCYGFDFAFVI